MLKLKIGIIVDQLLEGGVQKAAIEQVRELNKLGHSATLLIQMRKSYSTDFSYLLREIPYRYISDSYPRPFRTTIKFPVFNFLSTLHLLSPILTPLFFKKGSWDVLISWGSTTCLTAFALYKFRKIPYLAIIHDPFVYILEKVYLKTFLRFFFPVLEPFLEALEGLAVKGSKNTILISKVHFDYIKNTYKVEPKIVSLGVTIPVKVPSRRGENILSFGRW